MDGKTLGDGDTDAGMLGDGVSDSATLGDGVCDSEALADGDADSVPLADGDSDSVTLAVSVADALTDGVTDAETLMEGVTLGVIDVDGVTDDETGTGGATLLMFCCTALADTLAISAYDVSDELVRMLELLRSASAVPTALLAGTMMDVPNVLPSVGDVCRRRRASTCSRAT